MAPGFCAGLVVAPPSDFSARTIRMPRVLLPLPGGKDFLVTDVGKWDGPGGKVFRITAEHGKPAVITPVLTGLYMPHHMAFGPDGKVYVNEQGRIFRFDPLAADPQATIETVIADAPDTRVHFSLHPLAGFIFDANKDLLVSSRRADRSVPQGRQARRHEFLRAIGGRVQGGGHPALCMDGR